MGLGAALPPLDIAVNVAFPAITAAFALETQAIRWVVAAYVLTYASLMLAFGRLGDIVGYRRVFRAGLVLAAGAFVLCALAPDYGWLLAARTVQGVAAALLLSCAPALATSLYDESRRTWVLGAFASMSAGAAVVGPLVGGASIALLGWAGVFWFRAPLALLALALLPFVPLLPGQPIKRSFDLAGALLLAAGLAMLLLVPTLAQSGAAPSLLALVAGTILFVAFVRRQRSAESAFLPGAIVRDPGFVLLNLASVSVHLASFAIPLLVPYYLARISGYGALGIGVLLMLWALGMMGGSVVAAPVVRTLGRRSTALLGGVMVAVGQFSISLWPAEPVLMAAILMVQGAGVGLFQVAYTDTVIALLPRHDRGVAGSLTILTRTIGILVGAAALTAALHAFEYRGLAAGQWDRDAFLGAFQSVFRYSALLFAAFFAFASVRRRGWGGV